MLKGFRITDMWLYDSFVAIDGGPPKLTIDTKVVKMYDSLKVSPGEKIHLVCEGDVGKPRIPIFWLLDEVPKPQRLLGEKDGVKQGEFFYFPFFNSCTPFVESSEILINHISSL